MLIDFEFTFVHAPSFSPALSFLFFLSFFFLSVEDNEDLGHSHLVLRLNIGKKISKFSLGIRE